NRNPASSNEFELGLQLRVTESRIKRRERRILSSRCCSALLEEDSQSPALLHVFNFHRRSFHLSAPIGWALVQRSGNTKTVDVVGHNGTVPDAERRAKGLRLALPGATAHRVKRRIAAPPHRSIRRCPIVVSMPIVLAIFEDVAMHLVEPPVVRRECPDFDRLPGIELSPLSRDVIANGIRGGRACPAAVFPLGLAR